MSYKRGQHRDPLPKPDIAEVLQELGASHVPTGYGWVRMRCPFHEDRTPSASVNHDPDAGGFKCHSCGRHGDGLKLLQDELGLSFTEALERASNLNPSHGNRQAKSKRRRRASDLLSGESGAPVDRRTRSAKASDILKGDQ